jgi:hypothetical protein
MLLFDLPQLKCTYRNYKKKNGRNLSNYSKKKRGDIQWIDEKLNIDGMGSSKSCCRVFNLPIQLIMTWESVQLFKNIRRKMKCWFLLINYHLASYLTPTWLIRIFTNYWHRWSYSRSLSCIMQLIEKHH